MWVADRGDVKLFAYKLSDQTRAPSQDIGLVAANNDPHGVWSDGEAVYVVDGADGKIYVYQLDTTNAAGAPTVQGQEYNELALGQVLLADTTGISDADGKPSNPQGFTYQWVRVEGGTDIEGATAPFYYPTADDVGKSLKVRVGFEDGNGVTEGPLTSAASAAIADSTSVKVPWSTTMTVEEQGTTVGYSASNPSLGSIADDEFTHADTDYTVTGAAVLSTGLDFGVSPELGPAQLANWRLGIAGVGFALDEGTHATAMSASTVGWNDHNQLWNAGDRIALAVLVVNSPATGAPTISGNPQVGEALTAETFGISDGNGLSDDAQGFDYQWQRSDDGNAWTDIAGATAPNYWPLTADAGKHIRVRVSFEDDDGFDEGPIDSVGKLTAQAVYTATMTVDSHGTPQIDGYIRNDANYPDAALTPGSFTYQGVSYQVDRLTEVEGEDLVLVLEPRPSEEIESLLTLVTGTGRYRLEGRYSSLSQDYLWSVGVPDWSDGQTVSLSIEADTVDATADVIVQASTTVGVPWSATMTVGEETGGSWAGFLGSALNFVTTPFGALSDSAIDIVGRASNSVEGVTYDGSGSGTLTLYANPAFTGSVRLAYGADATLATIAATAGAEGTVDKYDWSPANDPGWSSDHKIAVAVLTDLSPHAATGTPSVTGPLHQGETLSVDLSGIMDRNGLPADPDEYSYQWIRVSGTIETDIPGATQAAYTLRTADVGNTIKVEVNFRDLSSPTLK